MEDRFNDGGTRYLDPAGREITEEEYLRSMKKKTRSQEKEVIENVESTDTVSGKN